MRINYIHQHLNYHIFLRQYNFNMIYKEKEYIKLKIKSYKMVIQIQYIKNNQKLILLVIFFILLYSH